MSAGCSAIFILDVNGKVFPEIIKSKTEVENSLNMNVIEIYGDEITPREGMNDDKGVSCNVPIEACTNGYVFCLQLSMVVPINYTEYEVWYEANK